MALSFFGRTLLALSASMILSCSTASQTAPAPQPQRPKMPPSTHLTEEARMKLRELMSSHGDNMASLMWSTVFIDLDSVGRFAKVIADGPKVHQYDPTVPKDERRPIPKDEQIPEHLFELQAQLIKKAEAVRALTESKKPFTPQQLGEAYADLMSVCITCHAYYRFEDAQIAPAP